MRVLLVSANYAPHVGGIERFAETLAESLADRGHTVNVVCCRFADAPALEQKDGFAVHRAPATYAIERRLGVPYPLPSPPALRRLMREQVAAADVVHVNDAVYATSVAALRLAHRRGVPSVLTQHVAFVPQQSRLLDGTQRVALATLGRSARLASVVATYNPAVADWVREAWGIASPVVLPVGVAAFRTSPGQGDRAAVRRSFGVPEDGLLALFVGRDVPKKGLDILLGAADPAYHVVAVTDRSGTSTADVTFLPFMPSERLGELMGCVDAFVLPSEGEGLPLAMQEALGAGLPVVTTMQPGYDRYLEPEDVLVTDRNAESLRKALLRLASSPDLQERLSERSRAVAERHFGVERFVSAYEEIYLEAQRRID